MPGARCQVLGVKLTLDIAVVVAGIMSWFPVVYDLPMRIADHGSKEWKEWKINSGTLCKIKRWQLHLEDEERLRSSDEIEVVLRHLPMCVFVEVDLDPPKQYEHLTPDTWHLTPDT